MKLPKKLLSAMLAMSVSMGTSALFPIAANAAATNWDAISEWGPDWVPVDFVSALNFHNFKGETYIQNDLICIVKHVPNSCEMKADVKLADTSEEDGEKAEYDVKTFRFDYEYFPDEPDPKDKDFYENYLNEMKEYEKSGLTKDGVAAYHYEAVIINNGNGKGFDVSVSINDKETGDVVSDEYTYTFARDAEGVMKETDIYGWLPDSWKELDDYLEKNGALSIKDGKLVYCGKYSEKTKLPEIVQTGTGKLKVETDRELTRDDVILDSAYPVPVLKVYTGETEGDVEVTVSTSKTKITAAVDKDMNVVNAGKEIPEWVPKDIYEIFEFATDLHGLTYTQDGLICVARELTYDEYYDGYSYGYEGSAAEKIDDYLIYNKFAKATSNMNNYYFDVNVYDIPADSDLTINIMDGKNDKAKTIKTLTFTKDSEGNVTETDIYSWLPDCEKDFEEYYHNKGAFYIKDGYVMYCNNEHGKYATWLYSDQNGSGEFIEEERSFAKRDPYFGESNTTHIVKLFKPKREGFVELKISKSSTTIAGTKSDVDKASFKIDKDMNITSVENEDVKTTVKGDCNGDGMLGMSDIVALKQYLHGKPYWVSKEFGDADVNGDGNIDVFDLIALRQAIIKSYAEAPKPVMVMVSENYLRDATQFVEIFDQYGNVYSYRFEEDEPGLKTYREDGTVLYMKNDNWFEKVTEIMEKASLNEDTNVYKEPGERLEAYYVIKSSLPDHTALEIAEFAKQTEKYTDAKLKEVHKTDENGQTTVYMLSNDSAGNPIYAVIGKAGNYVGWIEDDAVIDFIRTLNRRYIFGSSVLDELGE